MKTSDLKHALLISLLASMIAITGCQEKSPLEKAGDSIDNMADDAGDALEDANDGLEDAADDAADAIEDATD